jgi:hypothetical protein
VLNNNQNYKIKNPKKNLKKEKKTLLNMPWECLYYFGLSTKYPTKFFSIRYAKGILIFSILATKLKKNAPCCHILDNSC